MAMRLKLRFFVSSCTFFFTFLAVRAAFRVRFTSLVDTETMRDEVPESDKGSSCALELPVREPSGRRLPWPLKVRMSLLKYPQRYSKVH